MKYVSIDLETLGLNPQTCDTIEFGAVIDDLSVQAPLEELPRFHCYLKKENYRGEAYAMSMHPQILRRIAVREEGWVYYDPEELGMRFLSFLKKNGYAPKSGHIGIDKVTVAGKNFAAFDWNFLKEIPDFFRHVQFHHRVLDIGPLFFQPSIDSEIPNLKTCMERAGIEGEVQHTAVEDCIDVIKCIRSKFPILHCVD